MPPKFGQHTAEVLAEFGYSEGEIEALKAEGVVCTERRRKAAAPWCCSGKPWGQAGTGRRLNDPQIMPILASDRTADPPSGQNGAPQGP